MLDTITAAATVRGWWDAYTLALTGSLTTLTDAFPDTPTEVVVTVVGQVAAAFVAVAAAAVVVLARRARRSAHAPCCSEHRPGDPIPAEWLGEGRVIAGCCDPDDCGPCCENCPTCPTLTGAAVAPPSVTIDDELIDAITASPRQERATILHAIVKNTARH